MLCLSRTAPPQMRAPLGMGGQCHLQGIEAACRLANLAVLQPPTALSLSLIISCYRCFAQATLRSNSGRSRPMAQLAPASALEGRPASVRSGSTTGRHCGLPSATGTPLSLLLISFSNARTVHGRYIGLCKAPKYFFIWRCPLRQTRRYSPKALRKHHEAIAYVQAQTLVGLRNSIQTSQRRETTTCATQSPSRAVTVYKLGSE
jgi:hypothetical protein